MKPEIKQAWVAALRSGEYTQGRRRLRSDAGHCCLGVLCDLAVKAGAANWHAFPGGDDSSTIPAVTGTAKCNDQAGILPLEVRDWAGLDGVDATLAYKGRLHNLASLNDCTELSFSQVADLIEEQL